MNLKYIGKYTDAGVFILHLPYRIEDICKGCGKSIDKTIDITYPIFGMINETDEIQCNNCKQIHIYEIYIDIIAVIEES